MSEQSDLRTVTSFEKMSRPMTRNVAFLRGINVGGHNKVPMAALRKLWSRCGGMEVRTYLQSGNVAFEADAPGEVIGSVQTMLREELEIDVSIVWREVGALDAAIEADPFGDCMEADERRRFIGFSDRAPSPEAIEALDPDRSPGDRFAVVGTHIYLDLREGMGKSKLTNDWFEKRLGLAVTFRNYRTVRAMVR